MQVGGRDDSEQKERMTGMGGGSAQRRRHLRALQHGSEFLPVGREWGPLLQPCHLHVSPHPTVSNRHTP